MILTLKVSNFFSVFQVKTVLNNHGRIKHTAEEIGDQVGALAL